MLILLLCLSTAAQIISIIKTNPFKLTKYKNVWLKNRPKSAKIKNLCHYFIFVIKNKNKDKHNIQIKQTVLYFLVY